MNRTDITRRCRGLGTQRAPFYPTDLSDEQGAVLEPLLPVMLGGRRGFQVLPRRWTVERTHAWTARRRPCARDYERLPGHHEAFVAWSAILLMTRRLTASSAR